MHYRGHTTPPYTSDLTIFPSAGLKAAMMRSSSCDDNTANSGRIGYQLCGWIPCCFSCGWCFTALTWSLGHSHKSGPWVGSPCDWSITCMQDPCRGVTPVWGIPDMGYCKCQCWKGRRHPNRMIQCLHGCTPATPHHMQHASLWHPSDSMSRIPTPPSRYDIGRRPEAPTANRMCSAVPPVHALLLSHEENHVSYYYARYQQRLK